MPTPLLIILAGPMGLEPTPSGVTGRRYNQLNYDPAKLIYISTVLSKTFVNGRRNRTRTCDIHGVSVALSQLSYPPAIAQKQFVASSNIDIYCQVFKKSGRSIYRLRSYRHVR